MSAPNVPAGPPARPLASAQRLIGTLGGFGALAGLLIVAAFATTQPRIRANKAAALAAAINEVLAAPDRYDTLYVTEDSVSRRLPAGANAETAEAVYLGWRNGTRAGFAIVANGPGFQDNIRLIFGYDPATSRLLGMKVLESKETPGLGDRIYKDAEFVAQFTRVQAPLEGVKEGQGEGQPTELVMITGATISSRALIRAINAALERVGPRLAAYREEPSS
jgi:Na+-translocating ferredoxin:NAD+ oxidoreductase subunit G